MLLALIQQYGYLVIFLGTFVEGETVLLLAASLAHQEAFGGAFSLPWVCLTAFAGSVSSDQLMFFLGRRYGMAFLEKRPRLRRGADRLAPYLDRYETRLILGFRFLYGMRTVCPLLLGARGVPAYRFLLLNCVGAALWTVIFASLGYGLGGLLERGLRLWTEKARVHHEAILLILVLVLLCAACLFVWRMRSTRNS